MAIVYDIIYIKNVEKCILVVLEVEKELGELCFWFIFIIFYEFCIFLVIISFFIGILKKYWFKLDG